MKKIVWIALLLLTALLIFMLMTPIDTSMENSIKVSGTVKSVSEAGVNDMVFELDNDSVTYYINRAFEKGFTLSKAKKDFEGKKIKLFYADSWTPLAPFGTKSKHITHVAVEDNVIFSEW